MVAAPTSAADGCCDVRKKRCGWVAIASSVCIVTWAGSPGPRPTTVIRGTLTAAHPVVVLGAAGADVLVGASPDGATVVVAVSVPNGITDACAASQ